MKIRTGYYIRELPSKFAVKLLDGTIKIADVSPVRNISAEDLETLAAIESGIWNPKFFDEWAPYVYAMYGFEKVD